MQKCIPAFPAIPALENYKIIGTHFKKDNCNLQNTRHIASIVRFE